MFKKIVFLLGFLCLSTAFLFSQDNDTILGAFHLKGVEVTNKNYQRAYANMLEKVRKIYPYAVYAKSLLDQYNKDIAELDKKSQIKKYGKTALEKLKEDFEYTLKNMYTSEGVLLMKLINRETGITVYDIISKYRGKPSASFYNVVGKLFDQDLKVKYDKQKEDWLTERVLQDILAGKYTLYKMDLLTKESFKTIKKDEKTAAKKRADFQKEKKKAMHKKQKSDTK